MTATMAASGSRLGTSSSSISLGGDALPDLAGDLAGEERARLVPCIIVSATASSSKVLSGMSGIGAARQGVPGDLHQLSDSAQVAEARACEAASMHIYGSPAGSDTLLGIGRRAYPSPGAEGRS